MINKFTVFTQLCLACTKGKIGWHMQVEACFAHFISLPHRQEYIQPSRPGISTY